MGDEDGFQALLGMSKERSLSQDYRGLEGKLFRGIAAIERATAEVIAVRALIEKLPGVVQKEREYWALVNRDRVYPADPTRDYEGTDPEGNPNAVPIYAFDSQEEFERVMDVALSLRKAYESAWSTVCGWEHDIRTGVPHIEGFMPNERSKRGLTVRLEAIGSEATFIIPHLARDVDKDLKMFLESGNLKGYDTLGYKEQFESRRLM